MKKILLAFILFVGPMIFAADFSLETGVMGLCGKSLEMSYGPEGEGSYTLSEITWDIQTLMAGGKLGIEFEKIGFSFEAWRSFLSMGEMTDYDWKGRTYETLVVDDLDDWTDYSRSDIESSFLILEGSIILREGLIFRRNFRPLFGFRFEYSEFSDSLHEFVYSVDSVDGFRSWEGDWDGINAINYKIYKFIPYFGGLYEINFERFQMSASLKYCPVGIIKSQDDHVLRGMKIEAWFGYVQNISTDIDFKYYFSKRLFLSSGISYDFTFTPLGVRRITYSSSEDSESLFTAGIKEYYFGGNLMFGIRL